MIVALDTVSDLEKAIKATSEGNISKSRETIQRLFIVEEEIDELRRTVFEELTKGKLSFGEREDIMHLVKRLDFMADRVKDAARNVLVLHERNIPKEIWSAFWEMSINLVKTADTLKESLKNLTIDQVKAREMSEKVEDEENKVDKKFLEIKMLLLKHGKKINPWVLLILKDLLDSMEEAADSCADTGDYIRVLTVSFKQY